jgi:hypothetical protein
MPILHTKRIPTGKQQSLLLSLLFVLRYLPDVSLATEARNANLKPVADNAKYKGAAKFLARPTS